MARLYVVPGHGNGDPGASGGGYQEADLVRQLAARIKQLGGDEVMLAPFDVNFYTQNGYRWVNIPGGYQVLELHMDAADERAVGAHLIIDSRLEPDEYDLAIRDFVVSMWPGRSVSINASSYYKNPKEAFAMGYPYRLVENGFITNNNDRQRFIDRMDEIARGYLRCFGIVPIGSTEPVQPTQPEIDKNEESIVIPSDAPNFGGVYRCTVNGLNVRSAPSTSSTVVAQYNAGQTVELDDEYTISGGWVWGQYVGASSGQMRYVAVGRATGRVEDDDYLIKVG